MALKRDIENLADVKHLVDTFYDKIRQDEMLAPIFNDRIQDRWPQHLEKMYTFWQTVLLGGQTYFGSPFVPHAQLPVAHEHFGQWISLFTQTMAELFSGAKADEALWRANRMAEMFESKINYHRENPQRNIL